MARINLLPWRAERRKLRQKDFLGMLGLAVAAGHQLGDGLVGAGRRAGDDGADEVGVDLKVAYCVDIAARLVEGGLAEPVA